MLREKKKKKKNNIRGHEEFRHYVAEKLGSLHCRAALFHCRAAVKVECEFPKGLRFGRGPSDLRRAGKGIKTRKMVQGPINKCLFASCGGDPPSSFPILRRDLTTLFIRLTRRYSFSLFTN